MNLVADTITATAFDDQAGVRLFVDYDNTAQATAIVGRMDPNGFTQVIRSGANVPLVGGEAFVYDYEAPLDVDVYYVTGTGWNPDGSLIVAAVSNTVRIHSNGYSWLKDPGMPTRNLRLDELENIPELTRSARGGIFHIIDRTNPIVVTSKREGRTGELHFTTATKAQRQMVVTLLSRGQVLLLQTPDASGFGSIYVYVGDVTETRVGTMTEQTRKWTLPITMVDRPEGLATAALGTVWSDVGNEFATWTALRTTLNSDGGRMNWDDVLTRAWA